MNQRYKHHYPEKLTMQKLSDLLGIDHFTISTGGTVRKDFLEAVAGALPIEVPDEFISKDNLLWLIWESVRGEKMPDDRLARGSTVKDDTLEEIIEGIEEHGFGIEAVEIDSNDQLDPVLQGDERTKALKEVTLREGQNRFRTVVLDAYHATCAVTGTKLAEVLEAAHIMPYAGRRNSIIQNGLCLRRDIHSLFDRGLLAINERSHKVQLSRKLIVSETYGDLEGREISLPREEALYPSQDALRAHKVWAEALWAR